MSTQQETNETPRAADYNPLMWRVPIFVAITTLALAAQAPSQGGSLEELLRSRFIGKQITLKSFYCGDHLEFSADGSLLQPAMPEIGSWTTCGYVRFKNVEVEPSAIRFSGVREIVTYNGRDWKVNRTEPIRLQIGLSSDNS